MTEALLSSPAAEAKWKGLQWHGATCAILASGESLTQAVADHVRSWRFSGSADFSRRSIVVNTTWERARWADVLYACDDEWWNGRSSETDRRSNYERVRDPDFGFPGSLWTQDLATSKKCDGLNHIKSVLSPGLQRAPGVINQGGNGGYQAIGLAYQAGVKRILLFGFDMKGGHWHAPHQKPMTNPPKYLLASWVRQFVRLAADLKREGVEVLNCNPDSALTCFPKVNPLEALV